MSENYFVLCLAENTKMETFIALVYLIAVPIQVFGDCTVDPSIKDSKTVDSVKKAIQLLDPIKNTK